MWTPVAKPQSIALVVGAASPLGTLAAEVLAEQGYFVGLCDLSSEACARVEAALLAQGHAAQAFPADPSKKLAFQTMLEHFLEQHQRIDLLLNASLVAPQTPFLETDEWDWRRALDLNLNSVFIAAQTVGRVFRELGAGSIINLLDEASPSTSYRTAAAAVEAFSDSLRAELQPLNISVDCLSLPVEKEALSQRILALLQQPSP